MSRVVRDWLSAAAAEGLRAARRGKSAPSPRPEAAGAPLCQVVAVSEGGAGCRLVVSDGRHAVATEVDAGAAAAVVTRHPLLAMGRRPGGGDDRGNAGGGFGTQLVGGVVSLQAFTVEPVWELGSSTVKLHVTRLSYVGCAGAQRFARPKAVEDHRSVRQALAELRAAPSSTAATPATLATATTGASEGRPAALDYSAAVPDSTAPSEGWDGDALVALAAELSDTQDDAKTVDTQQGPAAVDAPGDSLVVTQSLEISDADRLSDSDATVTRAAAGTGGADASLRAPKRRRRRR